MEFLSDDNDEILHTRHHFELQLIKLFLKLKDRAKCVLSLNVQIAVGSNKATYQTMCGKQVEDD